MLNLICESKVEELEKEVQKEKELRTMYRKRLERTQDYLRYCLQTAKDGGFLQLIIRHKHDDEEHRNNNDNNNATDNNNISSNNNSNQREEVLVSPQFSNGNVSPQLPTITLVQPESDISIVVDQARINGWYIEPHEVSFLIELWSIICLVDMVLVKLQIDSNRLDRCVFAVRKIANHVA